MFDCRVSRGLAPGQMALVVALHGAMVWALMQAPSVEFQAADPVLSVSLLAVDSDAVEPVQLTPAAVPKPMPSRQKPAIDPRFQAVNPEEPSQIQIAAALPDSQSASQRDNAPSLPVDASVAVDVSVSHAPAPVSLPRFDAAYLDNPRPVYPPLSRRMGEQGKVLLRVAVDSAGRPTDVQLHQGSGSLRLDRAALDAVRSWRFTPARQGDLAVAASVIVPIVFSLKE